MPAPGRVLKMWGGLVWPMPQLAVGEAGRYPLV
jgi:hypothetical protein